MKKRISKYNKKKNCILNKLGMTYVELLCALSLLSLIVVMFTPMLLSSYENLYKAGETVEEVYDSKGELEEGLATRFSEKTVVFSTFDLGVNDLKTNADLLFEAINVNGKKVVSSLQQGLETVFGNARASVDIISPKIVYDDQSNHDVMIQTTGIEYSKVFYGSYSAKYGTNQETADAAFLSAHKANIAAGGKGIIFIEVIIPDKSKNVSSGGTTTEEAVYLSSNIANLQLYKVENMEEKSGTVSTSGNFDMLNTDNYGRIKFNISGRTGTPLDFTQSPIKINVYYINPREQVKEVSDYLIIDPPTMMFAGDTNSSVDYYTSAGVTEKDGTYSFELEARKMRIDNSGYLTSSDTPGSKGTRIQTITWVQEDENAKLEPYYVMAGTNSSVYRMYNYRVNTTIDEVFGISGTTDTPEGSFILSDGSVANPSFWSGEMSDQYYFRTENNGNGYGTEPDNTNDCSEETQYNAFDKKLRYLMAYSGFRTGYSYRMQASRRISYILTEANAYSFRFGGKKADTSQFTGYTAIWEPSGEYYAGGGETRTPGLFSGKDWDVDKNQLSQRIIAGKVTEPYEKPIYFDNYNGSLVFDSSENLHYERNIAWLGASSYTSVNIFGLAEGSELYNKMFGGTSDDGNMGFFFANKGDDGEYGGNGGTIPNYLQTDVATTVNVTSAVYLPGAGSSGQGQVIYFGSVPAYSLVRQSSDIGKPDRYMYNGKNIRDSRCTLYYIFDFSGSTIVARCASANNNNLGATSDILKKQTRNALWGVNTDSAGYAAALGSANELFTKANEDTTYYYIDSDLKFTFGYCSRWRMALGSVTSDGENEATKSYESFYVNSNPNATYTRVPSGGLNTGDVNNLYYNVWFPGEHYTLTQTATLDEITVACGYTVSGSSFMEQSCVSGCENFYGTALGSVYNDGVLAAYVSEEAGGTVYRTGLSGKGEQNAIFQNILYYKMPSFLNGTTHSRDSVRFTAVDLFAHTTSPAQSGNALTSSKQYFAVYGDSNGNAYYSIIATSTVTGSTEEGTATESGVVLRSGDNALTTSEMYPITLSNGALLSSIYSEVTTIDAAENIVVISGKAKDSNTVEQLVIATKDDEANNVWSFKRVYNGGFKGTINNAMILGDYYYIAGDGWIAAVSLDTLRNLPDGGTITNRSETDTSISGTSTNKDHLLWVPTSTNIYALGGRLTEG